MADEPITFGLFGSTEGVETFAHGDVVFTAGETGGRLYVVRSGEVVLEAGGRELECLGPGEMFGEMAVIDGSPRSATARAVGETTVVPVDGPRFHALIQHTPFFAENVMRLIARRLRRTTRAVSGG